MLTMGTLSSGGLPSQLTIQTALDIARNSEGEVEYTISVYLESYLQIVWSKLVAAPNTYILSKDEFALFNYFRQRFATSELAQKAVQRFWENYQELLRAPAARFTAMSHGSGGRASTANCGKMDLSTLPFRREERRNATNYIQSQLRINFESPLKEHTPRVALQPRISKQLPLRHGAETIRCRASRRASGNTGYWYGLCVFAFLAFVVQAHAESSEAVTRHSLWRLASDPTHVTEPISNAPLQNFQVASPVYAPPGGTCVQTLLEHSFGNSYGDPFVGQYVPPSCRFDRVVLNLTVTSQGRQFDRLGALYLNDTEIFRTSTAEPTSNGIVWTYVKDVSALSSCFRERQKIIFDLPNIVNERYTGLFNVSVVASFFRARDSIDTPDVVIPVSSGRSDAAQQSGFEAPRTTANNNITLPRNARKAFFTIAACGQADEEFWWSNVPSSTTGTFANTTLDGFSPFREIQLLIDGSLAGVAWPFPVVFTGGIVPGFWRPIAGIDAFDLQEDIIDISPWLPLLSDGTAHEFRIRVVGVDDNGSGYASLSEEVGSFWVVTGKILLWLDDEDAVTTGSILVANTPEPQIHVLSSTHKSHRHTLNKTLNYSVFVRRHLHITSTLHTSKGETQVSWSQSISYSNAGRLSAGGLTQLTSQTTSGADRSSNGYLKTYSYPLWVVESVTDERASGGNLTIKGQINRAKNIHVDGRNPLGTPIDGLPPGSYDVEPSSFQSHSIHNEQKAKAIFTQNSANNASSGAGQTEQEYELKGLYGPKRYGAQTILQAESGTTLYARKVIAKNAKVVHDEVSGIIRDYRGGDAELAEQAADDDGFVFQDAHTYKL